MTEGATFAFFLHAVEELQENERSFTLSANDLVLINPNSRTCPIFRSKRDMVLTKTIYTHIPILLKEDLKRTRGVFHSIECLIWQVTGIFSVQTCKLTAGHSKVMLHKDGKSIFRSMRAK